MAAIDDVFLTTEEIAKRTRVAESTLANQRNQGSGLPFTKFGGRVLYRQSDLADALEAGARDNCEATVKRAAKKVFKNASDEEVRALWLAMRAEALADKVPGLLTPT